MMNDATTMRVEGFAQGRLIAPVSFQLRSAGPQEGQYDPRPRYPDGTLVNGGFVTKSNRGRPKGTGTGLGIGHSKEAKEEMVHRYKNGEGLNPLAAAFSTNAVRVREILVQAGVTIRPIGGKKIEQRSNNMKLTEGDIREMERLRDEGQSYKEIGKKFGVAQTTVIHHVGKADDRGLKRGRKPRPVVAAAPEPPHLADLVAEAAPVPGDEAMDDPTPGAATKPKPIHIPADHHLWPRPDDNAAANDTRVISAQEVASWQRPLRLYTPPAVVFDSLLAEMVTERNVFAVAHTIKAMTDKMQAIAGVTASFRFSYEPTAGVRP